MPNEPPTLPVRTCTFSGGTPACPCQRVAQAEDALAADAQRVAAVSGIVVADAPSAAPSAQTTMRLLRMRQPRHMGGRGEGGGDLRRCRRNGSRRQTLPGASSWISGAPGCGGLAGARSPPAAGRCRAKTASAASRGLLGGLGDDAGDRVADDSAPCPCASASWRRRACSRRAVAVLASGRHASAWCRAGLEVGGGEDRRARPGIALRRRGRRSPRMTPCA